MRSPKPCIPVWSSIFILSLSTLMTTVCLAFTSSAGATLGIPCSGSSIAAQGSFLQAGQQAVLRSAFNNEADHSPRACSGTQGTESKPTISYTASGNLTGLESWGAGGHAAAFGVSNAFVATDVPPNAKQREEVSAYSAEPHWGDLQTIPLQQYTVAVIVNLPAHCKANNSDPGHSGFLILTNRTLEKIWRGQIHDWNEITDGGDVVQNLSQKTCEPKTPITRIVSRDDSGASWTLEKYLYLINKEKNIVGSKGWRELAEGASGAEWPGTVTRPSKEGEEAVVNLAEETPSSIAVVDFTHQVEEKFTGLIRGTAGEGQQRFVAEIQNNGLVAGGSATYAQLRASSDGNGCNGVEYTNDGAAGLPSSTSSLWNGVTTKTSEPGYPLCGLSYILALTRYSKFPGTTEAEATTVSDYLRFAVSTSKGGGLEEFDSHLSLTLLEEARHGIEEIQY